MIIDNKEAVFNGGPFQSYWWADEHEPVHLAIRAELSDDIDANLLEKAWENTKKVYPLIELVPDDFDEEVIFFKGEGTSRPIQSKSTLKLADEVTMFRGISLTYYRNTITLSSYHSIADEYGLNEIFRTLLNFYISERTNTSVNNSGVMMTENRKPEEYFIQNTILEPKNYAPQSVILYKDIREIFNDISITNNEDCAVTVGEIEISADALDVICKKYKAAPDEIFTYAAAKAVYEMYPNERRKLSFGIMTDFRSTFNVPDTIAPCSKKMPLVLSYNDIVGCDMRTAIEKIVNIRAYQKTDDYIKSHVALENSYAVLGIRNACLSVNFSGEFHIGEKTSYIKNITMSDYSMKSVFMIRLEDKFKVSFQYGSATDKYMDAVSSVLCNLGVNAKITVPAYPFGAETEKPSV